MIARKTVYESSEPRLCGLDCPRLVGIPPSLHCDTCMCLFHPSCVGYEQGPNIKTFICKVNIILMKGKTYINSIWHHVILKKIP